MYETATAAKMEHDGRIAMEYRKWLAEIGVIQTSEISPSLSAALPELEESDA